MSFLGDILGTAAGKTAQGLLDGIGNFAVKIRGAITGELPPEAQARLAELAVEAERLQLTGQMEINLAEAKSGSRFVAGWRPFIGWVCGLALVWNYLLHPLVVWGFAIWGNLDKAPPSLDMSQLMPVLLGILGLGAYRSYEKMKGVHQEH